MSSRITFENRDCMEALADFPDQYFDVAIVDPPYGDGLGGSANRFGGMFGSTINGTPTRKNIGGGHEIKYNRFGGRFDKYTQDPENKPVCRTGGRQHGNKHIVDWDVAPGPEYFRELFRVSKHAIIWGGNYFDLPPTRCFVVFRKTNIPEKGFSMAPVEYAWTNYNRNAVLYEGNTQAFVQGARFHPTQKPVDLYKRLLIEFAKPGDRILDTHVGSASSLIACYDMGFDAWGYEIDAEYYRKAKARLEDFMAQITFDDILGGAIK